MTFFCFTGPNLWLKIGDGWEKRFHDVCVCSVQTELRSIFVRYFWNVSTIGVRNFSLVINICILLHNICLVIKIKRHIFKTAHTHTQDVYKRQHAH